MVRNTLKNRPSRSRTRNRSSSMVASRKLRSKASQRRRHSQRRIKSLVRIKSLGGTSTQITVLLEKYRQIQTNYREVDQIDNLTSEMNLSTDDTIKNLVETFKSKKSEFFKDDKLTLIKTDTSEHGQHRELSIPIPLPQDMAHIQLTHDNNAKYIFKYRKN